MLSCYLSFVNDTQDDSETVPNKFPFLKLFDDRSKFESLNDEKVYLVFLDTYNKELQTLKSFLNFIFDKLERNQAINRNLNKNANNLSLFLEIFLSNKHLYLQMFENKGFKSEYFELVRKILMTFGKFLYSSENKWNEMLKITNDLSESRDLDLKWKLKNEIKATLELSELFEDYFSVFKTLVRGKENSCQEEIQVFYLNNKLIIYVKKSIIFIVKLKENQKPTRTKIGETTEIKLIYSIDDMFFVTFSTSSINIYTLPDFEHLRSYNSLSMPKPCNFGLVENTKIVFYDENKRVCKCEIKTDHFENYIIRKNFVSKAILLSENQTLIIGIKKDEGESIEIWDFHSKYLKFVIEIRKSINYILGKARISHSDDLIYFKSYVFDLKTLTFSDHNLKKVSSLNYSNKKMTDLNGNQVKKQQLDPIFKYAMISISHYPATKETLILAVHTSEKFLLLLGPNTGKSLKLQVSMNVSELKMTFQHIWMITSNFFIFWNLHSNTFEGSVSLMTYMQESSAGKRISIAFGKYLISSDSTLWKVFRFKINLRRELCKCDGIVVKNHHYNQIYIVDKSWLKIMTRDGIIKDCVEIHFSFKLNHAEFIDTDLLCLFGKSEILLYDISNYSIVELCSVQQSFDSKSFCIVKYDTFLSFYQKDLIFFVKKPFFIFRKNSFQAFKDMTFLCTPDEKLFIFISKQNTLVYNLETDQKKYFFYHSKNVEIFDVVLVYSRYLVLLISAPKLSLDNQRPQKPFLIYEAGNYFLCLIDLSLLNIQYLEFKNRPSVGIVDSQRILIRNLNKLEIYQLDDLKSCFTLDMNSFSFTSGSLLMKDKLIITNKQLNKSSNSFVWGFPLSSLSFAHFSSKRIYLSGKNFDFLILNLKHLTIEAIFFKNFCKSIKEIYEFPDQNFLILRNSKKILKFDLKTFKITSIHSHKSKPKYFSVLNSRYFCYLYMKPSDSIRIFIYDVVSEKQFVKENELKIKKVFLIKVEKFLVLFKPSINFHYEVQHKYLFKLIDLDSCDKDESWYVSSYRYCSNRIEGSAKVKIRERFLIVLSKDKRHVLFAYDLKWVILELNTFTTKFQGESWKFTQTEFSLNGQYFGMGTEYGEVLCYDLINVRSFQFHPHLSRVSFLAVNDDGSLLSHSYEEKQIVKSDIYLKDL